MTTNKAVDQAPFRMTRKVAAERRARIVAIVEGLPETAAVAAGNHLSLEVRQKRFGWRLDDHHGDGRLAINCKHLLVAVVENSFAGDLQQCVQDCAARLEYFVEEDEFGLDKFSGRDAAVRDCKSVGVS